MPLRSEGQLSFLFVSKWKVKVLVTQSCLTLCDPMDCSLPGSSVHGIFQARVLEWAAISFSRGSCQPRDHTQVSCTAGRIFTIWATRETRPHRVWAILKVFSPSGLIGVIWKVRLILAEEILTLISVDQLLTCLREGPLEIQKSPELDSTLLPFIFLSSKTTADGGRSHEIKRR